METSINSSSTEETLKEKGVWRRAAPCCDSGMAVRGGRQTAERNTVTESQWSNQFCTEKHPSLSSTPGRVVLWWKMGMKYLPCYSSENTSVSSEEILKQHHYKWEMNCSLAGFSSFLFWKPEIPSQISVCCQPGRRDSEAAKPLMRQRFIC